MLQPVIIYCYNLKDKRTMSELIIINRIYVNYEIFTFTE